MRLLTYPTVLGASIASGAEGGRRDTEEETKKKRKKGAAKLPSFT